jgi:hypothetical protein
MKGIAFKLDGRAKGLAADYLRTEGELLSVLMEMRKQRVFAELNYSGIFDYCERALKFSRAQAFYFKTVAEKSEEVPEIRAAIVQGELTLSQARRIVSVVTKDNHKEWIEKAKSLPQKALEREVTAVNPKSHVQEKLRPVAMALSELKVGIDEKTEQNLRVLQDILSQKMGKPATLAQVIVWTTQVTREKFDPVRRAERSISSRKSPLLAEASKAKTGRSPIAAAARHPVVLRDTMQCTYISQDGRRCAEKRWLDLHHKIEVAKGGPNTIDNLRILCRAHHDLFHSETQLTG